MQATATTLDATSPQAEDQSSQRTSRVTSDLVLTDKSQFPQSLKGRRVLLATESLGPVNGVSRTTSSLIHYLRENGVQVAIVAPRFDAKKLKNIDSISVQLRLNGYPLPYNPDLSVAYPFRFDNVCRRTSFQPEIVYLASPASVGFQFLLQIRQLAEAPIVLLNFQTDLSSYSEIIFPAVMNHFAVWLLGVVQGFLFSHRTVQTIFYPSSGIRKYLEQAGVPSSKLVHLGRGVNTSLFNPSNRDESYRRELAPNGEIILVCVGRLAPEKGFEFLANVTVQLIGAGVPLKLVIAGGNTNVSVENDVRRLFDGVRDHVIFTGFLHGARLARVYASGDIFVHCSITETFGLVVLEAMACGLPVVARDQGGPSEIVLDGETGFLVSPNDMKEFVRCVKQLRDDLKLHSTMVTASLRVANDTTWDKINQKVAWNMAEALERHFQEKQARKIQRPIRNWLSSIYHETRATYLLPVLVSFRLKFSVGIVFLMWIIAVLPLIIHGSSAFPRDWSRPRLNFVQYLYDHFVVSKGKNV